ncbi:glycosyltransferase [Candidatus Aenigmatarchaeota archaeon]
MVTYEALEAMFSPVWIFINQASGGIFEVLVYPVAVFSIFFYFFAISGFFYKKNILKVKAITSSKLPKITIQIPTYNEIVAIRCAKKCLNMIYPKDKYEIIIGDDSTDKSISKEIDSFAKKHKNVRVTRRGTNKGFKPGNLNHMLKFTKGDIIVIFDSDFTPSRNFLKNIVRPFVEDKKVACVQAKWAYSNMSQNRTSKFASMILMVYHNLIAKINQALGVPLLFGSGEAIRKSVLTKLGGWKEGSLTEDVDYAIRVLKSGYKTIYLENVSAPGEVPFTLKGLRIQQRRWAYGNVKVFMNNWKAILKGNFSVLQKIMLFFTLTGYVGSLLLIAFLLFGTVSFITTTPAPIDVYNFTKDVSINFVIASGFMIAGLVALVKNKKIRYCGTVVLAALTIGMVVSVSVSIGLFKAAIGKKMNWTMIEKVGNKTSI